MSGIKAPVVDIINLLQTINVRNGDGNTVPLRARIWNNQLRQEVHGELYNFPKPAVFLEVIPGAKYEQMGTGYQSADIGWRVHLVHEFYDAQDGTMEQDLEVFDLRDQIITKLSFYEATACGPLVKTGEDQDYDHTNVYHYMIDFICDFIDSKGSKDAQGVFITKAPPTNAEIDITTPAPQTVAYLIP